MFQGSVLTNHKFLLKTLCEFAIKICSKKEKEMKSRPFLSFPIYMLHSHIDYDSSFDFCYCS